MKKIKLILVGGFLGSGKTTALCRLAKHFTGKGFRVGLITNDQADNLVDTHLVKTEGFNAEEVPGGCFCCKFNDLVEAAGRLIKKADPDVILAEPVGSCTDLVATVIRPLKSYHRKEYDIRAYTTLLDPKRAMDIVISGKVSGFSKKVTYVFKKQLEESDIIVLNKTDALGADKAKKIIAALRTKFPDAKIMGMSARTGKGFDAWVKAVESAGTGGRHIVDVDYDIYAAGEAELAWLNLVAGFSRASDFSTDKFLEALATRIKKGLSDIGGEIAHLKLALSTENGNSFIHLAHSGQPIEFFRKDAGPSNKARLIVNARVHTDPRLLFKTVSGALKKLCKKEGIRVDISSPQYFRPGRPVPVHRFARTRNRKPRT